MTTDETVYGNAPRRHCSCYSRVLGSHCDATGLAWERTDGKQEQRQRRQIKGNGKRSCRGKDNDKQAFVECLCSSFALMNSKIMERGASAARGDDGIAYE